MWKKRSLKSVSIILVIAIVVSFCPKFALTDIFADANNKTVGGQIVIAAANSSEVIIEPVFVDYYVYDVKEGDETVQHSETIAEFLERDPSGHSFTAQTGSGFYNFIDGIEGQYNRFDNNGNYDVDVEIAGKAAFFFVGNEMLKEENVADFSLMLQAMATFNASTNGVKLYQPAIESYANALAAFFNKNADYKALTSALTVSMANYVEEVLNAKPATLQLAFVNTNAELLTNYTFTVVDAYGNEKAFTEKDTAALISGTYNFKLSNGGSHYSEGTMTVKVEGAGENAKAVVIIADKVVTSIVLYTGANWIGDVLLHPSNLNGIPSDAYASSKDGNSTVYFIPDYEENTYIYISKGEGIDETTYNSSNVKVWPYYIDTRNVVHNGSLKTDYLKLISGQENLVRAIEAGSQSTSVVLKAKYEINGYTIVEDIPLELQRTPSLKNLVVKANGVGQNIGFEPSNGSYVLSSIGEEIVINPVAYGSDYSIEINGEKLNGTSCKNYSLVNSLNLKINVSNSIQSKTYNLVINKVDAIETSIEVESGDAIIVYTLAGGEIGYKNVSGNKYTFNLVDGEEYEYVVTRNGYYHVSEKFKAASGLTIQAKTPKTNDWLSSLKLMEALNIKNSSYVYLNDDFKSDVHSYSIVVPDFNTAPRIQAILSVAGISGTITVVNSGVVIKNNNSSAQTSKVLANGESGDIAEDIVVRVSKQDSQATYYQDYVIKVTRSVSLKNSGSYLTVDGSNVDLYKVVDSAVTTDSTFSGKVLSYQANVLSNAEDAVFKFTPSISTYSITYNGQKYYADNGIITVPVTLDYTKTEETFAFKVESPRDNTQSEVYTVKLVKRDPISTSFTVKDGNLSTIEGLVTVYDYVSGKRIWPENGAFKLIDSMKYKVITTCYGYVGDERIITAGSNNSNIVINLNKAATKIISEGLSSSWPYFRGNSDSNGVINFKTPITSETAVLSWATKLGDGYGSEAVGCPILITEGDYEYLIVYSRNVIYKVDALSGTVVASGQMCTNSNFSINSATYAEGMIFIGLSNGTVQAFDAKTLESLWEYHDELGGQPNCPITYWNGYIYTGFWNAETRPANYVCLSVTDEDTSTGHEIKQPTWKHEDYGFYWAGAYVDPNGDFLLVTTDDGDGGYLKASAKLLCMNPLTGEVYDALTDIVGDARSSVSSDGNGRYYFTSKGGYMYSVKVNVVKEGGKVVSAKITDRKEVSLQNYHDDENSPAMSTCTPVIYNGRAYIGVSGVGQFTQYSGHNITVIDLTSWRVIYSLPTQGYPQTSGLLTTAYEQETGNVYIYFFDNMTPGKLRVLVDNKTITTATQALATTEEVYINNGNSESYKTPYVLFTPTGEQAQYVICSPIADSLGNIYFKNDSANLMSVMNTITSMRVVTNPEKTSYKDGEPIDLSGMEIEITYSNGLKKLLPYNRTYGTGNNAVSIKYFEISGDSLAKHGENKIYVAFSYAMYQNKDGEVGVDYVPQTAELTITVDNEAYNPPQEESKLAVSKDAKLSYSAEQGSMLSIDLSKIFTYSGTSTVSYSCANANNGTWGPQSKLSGSTLIFTNSKTGTYTGTVGASVGSEKVFTDITITVTEADAGLDIQYSYEQTDADYVKVYVTMSHNGIPLIGNDKDNTVLMHLEVNLPYFDLAKYDISNYYRYYADESGTYINDTVIKRPTAMHLMIYLTIKYFLGIDATDEDIKSGKYNPLTMNVSDYIQGEYMYNMFGEKAYAINKNNFAIEYTGGAQSTYMKQLWGYDENLMYYRNHVYPLQSPGWGSTSDYILLSDGDTFDESHYSNWNFYQYGAFCTFRDANNKLDIENKKTNNDSIFVAKPGETFNFSAVKFGTQSVSDGGTDNFLPINSLKVMILDENRVIVEENLEGENGSYSYTFTKEGTYYIVGLDENSGDVELACNAPATAKVVVTNQTIEPDVLKGDVNGDGKVNAKDIAVLCQYQAGLIDNSVAKYPDVNGDGKENAKDIALLSQYQAGLITLN